MAGSKLPSSEVEQRIAKCYELRYETDPGIGVKGWYKYCQENYGDKSEQQYTAYWMASGEKYQEGWRELLNKQLTPAVHEIIRLLADENPKVRSDAAKMIFKYTGHEIDRQEVNLSVTEYVTKWGADATSND